MAKLSRQSAEVRRKVLENTLNEIKKKNKEVFCELYGESGSSMNVEFISTGSLAVDEAIGGGFAKGRLIELVGLPSSGKTTLALTAIANLQKEDPEAGILYVDAEAALDPRYAKMLGVDLDKVVLCQPSNGEEGYEVAEMYIRSGLADIVVIDSIAAMRPKAELEKDFSDELQPGRMAKLTTAAANKLSKLASENKVTVILINQLSPMVKLNQYAVSGASQVGSYYTPGGNALMFFVTQFLQIAKTGTISSGSEKISNTIKMKCMKNKVGVPFRECEFVITFGKGLDEDQEIIGLGLSSGFIRQSGSFYTIPGLYIDEAGKDKSIQGRLKLSEMIAENVELKNKLKDMIKKKISGASEISIKKDSYEELDVKIEKNPLD